MGMFFSNLHIKKNEGLSYDTLEEALIKFMADKGWRVACSKKKSDISLSICMPPESEWITVCSELFEFYDAESVQNVSLPLSDKLKTDVLAVACVDSDYLFLNLVNSSDNTDACANIGVNPDGKAFRRTAFGAWKSRIKDEEAFRQIVRRKYLFAQEALEGISKMLGMTFEQSVFSSEAPKEANEKHIKRIYFSMPENTEEPVVLAIPRYGLMPCKCGVRFCETIVNKGSRSKGIAIVFAGDYVENDEIVFKDICLRYSSDKYGRGVDVTLEKRRLSDGRIVYWWEDKEFVIPEKANQMLPARRLMKDEFEREIFLNFTPFGNTRKFLDICIYFIPLSNYDGQCCWCVWHHAGSKEAFIEMHNKGWAGFPDEMLDKNDYDL